MMNKMTRPPLILPRGSVRLDFGTRKKRTERSIGADVRRESQEKEKRIEVIIKLENRELIA